ncbi:MAG: trehalose-phosphatase [Actinobacteria bacterium]|nr:trehalose-phosphatase [Actinomycetota bacterium]
MRRYADDLSAILAQLGDLERRFLILDFDGTLSWIVDHPDDAQLADGAEAAVRELADRITVVVLSGRSADDVSSRLGDLALTVIGGHGTEVIQRDGERAAVGDVGDVTAELDEIWSELEQLVDASSGWQLERKKTSIAVHHRRVAPEVVAHQLPEVASTLERHTADGWQLLRGKAVLELRRAGTDKGDAVRWIAREHPGLIPFVLGDDVTDEDAFEAAEDLGGDAILVADRPRPTAARWRLEDPNRVVEFLRKLAVGEADRPVVRVETDGRHPIGSYGMIGDSRTAALVSPDASVDWLCVPRFDSPSVFAALLDPVRGGRFRIRPAGPALTVQRTYLGETNVLVTRFVDRGNPVMTVTDFFVYSRVNAFDATHTGHLLLRRVEAFRDVTVDVDFQPRFDYARARTDVELVEDGAVGRAGVDWIRVRSPEVAFQVRTHEDGLPAAVAQLDLHPGDDLWFRLETTGSERGPHNHLSPAELLDLTVRTWGRWAHLIDYTGPWRDLVVRSALLLKGLVYEPTGALVAAPTTSLPETLGGERNWDYRFAWIRDSAYVLETFLRIGHAREAETFIRWLSELSDRIGGANALRPLYRITGEEDLTEFELEHLNGYADSRPVRIGNGAASQLQLDIYGAAMQLGYLTEQFGGEVPAARWPVIRELVGTVIERWRDPDSGLWEIRSAPRHHTFSKFQCWLAVDRAIRIGRGLGLRAPYERWQGVADEISDSILEHGYDDEVGSFVQAYGSKELDASVLLLPLRGFLPPRDHRVRGTVAAVRRELEIADGLLLRYRSRDGLRGEEGAFLMCSFWLVELLARMGELDEAVRIFERLVSFAGTLGLYAEELDPATHEHLGNFPQGFTHMGLIGAATAIDEELHAHERSVRGINSTRV